MSLHDLLGYAFLLSVVLFAGWLICGAIAVEEATMECPECGSASLMTDGECPWCGWSVEVLS